MEVTALGNELSGLKIDLAEKRPAINYGAQELLIQQLQDEIMNLKQQGADYSEGSDVAGVGQGQTTSSSQTRRLQEKLRSAAKKITELSKERQQLIEMGNKLRAELKKAGIDTPMLAPSGKRPLRHLPPPIREESSSHMSSQPLSEKFMNKLSQLEKLQYQLTRQELQYAQKYQGSQPVNGESSYSETDEYRPPSILKRRAGVGDSLDTEVDVRASMNTEGGETLASVHSAPTARSQLLMSMSSMGGESLQEIWKMLDEGRPSPTPRPTTATSPRVPQRETRFHQSGEAVNASQDSEMNTSRDLYLSGRHTGQPRTKSEKKYSDRVAGKLPKKVQQKTTVRNYNVRDDSGIR